MSSTALRRWLVVLLFGVALFANPLWLFPQEVESRYTYERIRLVPENGTVANEPDVGMLEAGYHNDLRAVGCEWPGDPEAVGRVCALEHAVLESGPVAVDTSYRKAAHPEYVELEGQYYERVTRSNDSTTVLRLRPVEPSAVLADAAIELQQLPTEEPYAGAWSRALANDEPIRSTEPPDEARVGEVFRYQGTYYTVAVTDVESIETPLPDGTRLGLRLLGLLVAFVAGILVLGELTDRR